MEKRNTLRVGIVGFSNSNFDVKKATKYLISGIKEIIKDYDGKEDIEIVSGYTDYGIPALSYRIANKLNLQTVGFACSQADNMKKYPVDKFYKIGDEWGDESKAFLDYIDVILRVGGGKQSKKEVKQFKRIHGNSVVYEYNLFPKDET